MFSLSSLVGQRAAGLLEFTPIGRRTHVPDRRPSPYAPRRLNAEKINTAHPESSFEEFLDNNETLPLAQIMDTATAATLASGTGRLSAGELMFLRNTQILGAGSGLIQDLQAENRRLGGENYNLKIEVATLTKFLKQTPEEQRDLVNQNVDLKQQLARLRDELDAAVHAARNADTAVAKSGLEVPDRRADLERQITALNREIALLKLHNETLEARAAARSPPRIPHDVLEKLEFLQNENQLLRRSLEARAGSSPDDANALKLQVHRLEQQLAAAPADAADRLSALQDKVSVLQRTIHTLEDDVAQAHRERDAADTAYRAAQHQAQEQVSENARLLEERDQARRDLEFTSHDSADSSLRLAAAQREALEARKEAAATRRELDKLAAKLRQAESELADTNSERNIEVSRLQRKLDTLAAELKTKDKDEYELRAQLRALMDERSLLFDNQATARHYQQQIETLRSKDGVLATENRTLKDEIARLQDELYAHSTETELAGRLKANIAELNDKLAFYEKEYEALQDAMEAAGAEVQSWKDKYKAEHEQVLAEQDRLRAEDQRFERERHQMHALESEVAQLKTQLRRSELSASLKYNESALIDLEETHRKREESEKTRMLLQIAALNTEIKRLQADLALARLLPLPASSPERYTYRSDRLQRELADREAEIAERQRTVSRLQASLKDKEDVIVALEARVRDLTRANSEDLLNEVMRLRSQHETQLKSLERDHERLRAALEEELRYYKTKVDIYMERESQPQTTLPIEALLESELEEARRKIAELKSRSNLTPTHTGAQDRLKVKIEQMQDDISRLEIEKSRLEDEKLRLEDDRSRLEDEKSRFKNDKIRLEEASSRLTSEKVRLEDQVEALESDLKGLRAEKIRLEDLLDSAETNTTILQSEKTRLETRVKTLSLELARTSRHCQKLASKVSELELVKADSRRRDNIVQNQIDLLANKLEAAELDRIPQNEARERLLRNELSYYKARLFEINLRCNDLQLINTFMMSSIKNSDRLIKNEVVRLAQCGIYPDYEQANKPKLTLKVLATFVLSSVRMKRRAEKTKARNALLWQLRADIERDKLLN